MHPHEDDQRYFHLVYLNETLRAQHNIKLDHYSKLVQNVLGAYDELEFHCISGQMRYTYDLMHSHPFNLEILILSEFVFELS